jgi:uncharacterized cupredoxin-like copper-binding protein
MPRVRVSAALAVLVAACALLVACSSGSALPGAPAGSLATPDASGVTTVHVSMNEWALRPDTEAATAGTIAFVVKNAGTVPHEMTVIRTDLAPKKLPVKGAAADTGSLDVVDTLTQFGAGETKDLTVTLTPGHYVLICNLPGHYQLGMRTALTVE